MKKILDLNKTMSDIKNSILSGFLSGSLTAIIFQPFEYVKTRQQQPAPTGSTGKAHTKLIYIVNKTLVDPKNPNAYNLMQLSKFWSGLKPSLLRSIPVAAIYFR